MDSSPWKAIAAFGIPLIVVFLVVGLLTRTIGLIHIIILLLWFGIIVVTVAVAALVWKAVTRPSPQQGSTGSAADELTKLAALHRQGALTDAEFAAQKHRLLDQRP